MLAIEFYQPTASYNFGFPSDPLLYIIISSLICSGIFVEDTVDYRANQFCVVYEIILNTFG